MKKGNSLLRVVSVVLILSFVAGCATSPEKISATYVSPLQYQSYNCNQLKEESLRVSSRVMEVTGQQKKEATKDAVAMGVGLVLFWPALFFLIGDDKKEELGRLKGEYEALDKASIAKECSTAVASNEAIQPTASPEAVIPAASPAATELTSSPEKEVPCKDC
ncbi:MAG: metal ABC transporter ATP-binding protein [Nitrospirota bacterium]